MPISAVDLPFREQSEFLRRKLNVNTESWIDIYAQQHDWAFMVAGANRDAIVEDFRSAVERAIDDGITLDQFRKDFDGIVERHGWSYNGGRNWRSRIIYDTNLNQSYQAGRYEQLMAVREDRPYWQYLHSDAVEHPRPLHQAWHGMVLRWDDPWWRTHFPSNGWGCQCRVIALSESDLRAMGKSGPDTAPPVNMEEREIGQRSPGGPITVTVPEGVDPGFEYRPGQSRMGSRIVPPRSSPPPSAGPRAPDAPPPARQAPVGRLPDDASPPEAIDAFLTQLGQSIGEPGIFRDIIGEARVIGRGMFDGYRGPLRDTPLWAQALRDPDEIYTYMLVDQRTQKAVTRRRYLVRYILDGIIKLFVMDFGRDGWFAESETQIGRFGESPWRSGERVYKRGES